MKTTCILLGAAGLLLLSLDVQPIRAQSPAGASPFQFEVASVKLSKGLGGVEGGCHGINSTYSAGTTAPPPLGRCVITGARLGHLINIAFDLGSTALIKSGPDWIARGEDRYNIEAKADEPSKTTEEQLLKMLQNLLVDRFQLKFHRENVDMSGFALVVAKNGPKLHESKADDVRTSFGEGKKPTPGGPVSIKAQKYTMPMLANLLSQVGGHGPVADKTGLKGEYDLLLSWDDDAGPALPTALQEQLGLRFESQKVPVSYFVVDAAKKPSEN